MSEIVKVKSGSLFEERNSYSRLVQAGDFVFVSNTAGRNYRTRAIADDVIGQCEQAFRNIEAALAAVDLTLKDVVAIRCHIPDPAETGAVGGFLGEKFRGIDPAATMICTPLAKPEMKVEFEVTAYRRRDAAAPEKRMTIEIG